MMLLLLLLACQDTATSYDCDPSGLVEAEVEPGIPVVSVCDPEDSCTGGLWRIRQGALYVTCSTGSVVEVGWVR